MHTCLQTPGLLLDNVLRCFEKLKLPAAAISGGANSLYWTGHALGGGAPPPGLLSSVSIPQ